MSSDNQAPDQESTSPETEVDITSKSAPAVKRRGCADTVRTLFTIAIFIWIGVAGIAATLSGHSNSFVGSDNTWNIVTFVCTIVATAALMWYVAFRYNSAGPILHHMRILAVVVSINVYLAISVWIVI